MIQPDIEQVIRRKKDKDYHKDTFPRWYCCKELSQL